MKIRAMFALVGALMLMLMFPSTVSAQQKDPFALDKPLNLKAELKYTEEGVPYFELKLDIPKSVQEINEKLLEDNLAYDGYSCYPIYIQFDYKYGNYDWNEGDSYYWDTSRMVESFLQDGAYEYYAFGEEAVDGSINIEAEVYQFRAYFYSDWGHVGDWVDKKVMSDFSNTVTIGNTAYYKGASAWAQSELDKALGYGFVTERIRDNMSARITREEFAEVAVKLYEKYSGKEATYSNLNVFTDTKNPEIVKAYELKIVNGVGNNKFAPNDPINREQMAAMLYRLVNAISPGTDFSTTGAPSFADEKEISGWALENVKFMSKHGFINGVGENRFAPKNTSTREQAVAVSVRVYEKYTKK